MAVAINSWANAERKCIEYLSKKIPGSVIAQNFFIGEIPVGAYNVWSFAITGPSGTDFLAECMGTTRNMEATIDGLFREREDAQQIEQDVRTSLPATTIDNVPRLAQTAEASLVREFLEENLRAGFERAGGVEAMRVWRLTIPMMVAFNNIE